MRKTRREYYEFSRDKILAHQRKLARQEVAELKDSYIIRLLKLRGFRDITKEMIETKRQQLKDFRFNRNEKV